MTQVRKIPFLGASRLLPCIDSTRDNAAEVLVDLDAVAAFDLGGELCERRVDRLAAVDVLVKAKNGMTRSQARRQAAVTVG